MEILNDRATALGLAERTRKNLRYIEVARSQGADVHEVTQIVISVLGIVIIPWERNLKNRLGKYGLEDLYAQGWPQWNISLGSANTLKDLVRKLRNGTAHGRYRFSSNARDPEDVTLIVEDALNGKVHWRAEITAVDLKEFCYRFLTVLLLDTHHPLTSDLTLNVILDVQLYPLN